MFQNWEFLILEIWVHLLIAVVLTLILSWAIWGFRARSERIQLATLRDDLQKAKRTLETKSSDLEQAFSKQEQLKDRMAAFQTKLADSIAAQKQAEAAAETHKAKLTELMASRDTVEKDLALARQQITTLRGQHDAEAKAAGGLTVLKDRLTQDVKNASTWTKKSVSTWFGK